MAIFVTGGAGYIGSHTVLSLLNKGEDVIVLDNLSNSSFESLRRVEQITQKKVTFYEGDVNDSKLLKNVFSNHAINAVIHFAALKSVSESSKKPLSYYLNNVSGLLVLLQEMQSANINKFVFSSSATVYGIKNKAPNMECSEVGNTTNPYGTSKLFAEKILQDFCSAYPSFSVIALRYFNPVGAHESGLIGEDPNGIPNNLVPYIAQVAVGKLEKVAVFGSDYETIDGTGVRDYIHVMDLADGHVKAIKYLSENNVNFKAINLGTGRGYSVLEIIKCFEKVSGRTIPFVLCPRRSGDLASSWASTEIAAKELKWKAKYDLEKMLSDTWNWQLKNPNGF